MANNRGGIPMYNENPQYSATISSQLPQGSPAMFGTQVAKERAGLGDAMVKLGTNVVDWAVKMQEKEDDNYIMRRENEMRKALNDLMYNPQTGLTNQKLHNAKGATMAFDDEVDKLTQQFMSDVNNPNLQAKFQQRIAQWIPGYRTTIAKHEGDEIFNARKTDYATNTKDQTDEFVANPSREGVARYYQGLQMNKSYLINTLGLSPEAAEEEIQSNFSKGVLLAGEKFVGLGDTQGILDLRNAVHGKVSAETETKLATMAGKIESQMKGIQKAKAILNDPRFKNPDGTYNVAALKEFEKLHGKGSTRIERILVDGGSIAYFSDSALNGDISAAAQEFNVDPALVAAVAQQESNGRQSAVSPVGALGVMQLMPDTATRLGVDPSNQKDNVRGGAKYLKQMLDRYNGDIDKALAAYNAGPGAVDEYGGIPPYKETQKYVDAVKWYYEQNKQKKGQSVNISNHTFYTVKPGKESEVEGLTHDTWVKLQGLAAAYERQFGGEADYEPFFVTAGGSQSGHNPGSKHYSGNAFDIAMDSLKRNPERFAWLEENAPKYGLKPLNEYNGYGNEQWADGENFHFSNDGTAIDEKKIYAETSKGGHYEERTVSNYNEQEYNEGYKYITEQIQFSKAEHDDKIKNAITQARLEAKSAVTQSELWNIAHKYADNETDAQTIYSDISAWRIDLKEQDENRERRKKDEADNWDNFLGWWVNNADADPSTVRATAAQYHIGNAHMAEVLRSKGLGVSGKGSDWAKGGNLKTFDWMAEKYKLTADEKVYVWQKINNANEQSIADTGAPLDEGQIKSIMDHEAASIKVNPSGTFDRVKAFFTGESKVDSGHRYAEGPLGWDPIDTKPGWFRTPDGDEVHWVEGKGWTNVE